jgi:glyoxylase-like metal-dependent hydrolase (beta-lactamase superfamily II)
VLERWRAPLWAHERTGELIDRPLARALKDGDEIDLGEGPDGRGGWTLRALFTPGHAEGHLALHDERYRSLTAGDLVSTLISMYVGAPGGNLRLYLESIRRMAALPLETVYPSHGAPDHNPAALFRETIRHRLERIEETLGRLGAEPRETEAIAREIYPEPEPALEPLVVRATRAALQYLVEEGRAVLVDGDRFARAKE